MVLAAGIPHAHAQQPIPLRFEVASIRHNRSGDRESSVRIPPGGERYIGSNATQKLLIVVAYRLRNDEVIGGPSWIGTDSFDMNAKAERPSTFEQMHLMLQNLLLDRFQLRFHQQAKEAPVYALVVDKAGFGMKRHDPQNAGEPFIDQAIIHFPQTDRHAKSASMSYLAWRLSIALDRPVVDHTNLPGSYDFDLSFTRELPPGMSPNALVNGERIDTSGPTIFEALRKQLGLSLESQKALGDAFVTDHADQPSEN